MDINERLIVHGSSKIVTIRQGVCGIIYDDGRLAILDPGRIIINDRPTWSFAGFLPCGQRTLTIAQVTSLSADNVPLCFDAAITVRVVAPLKAVTMLGKHVLIFVPSVLVSVCFRSPPPPRLLPLLPGRAAGMQSLTDSTGFNVEALYSAIQQKSRLALSTIIGNNR